MKPNFESAVSDDDRSLASAAPDELVLVSNREPYRHEYDGNRVTVEEPAGGLAMGIDPVMQRIEGTWIAWGDGDADFDRADDDGTVAVPPSNPAYRLQRLRLTDDQVSGYYEGYANRALWPLCHTMPSRMTFRPGDFEQYRSVNRQFADAVVEHATEDTTVWFQDYHVALAPRLVADALPDAFRMHFFHVPWPAVDVFRLCPNAETLIDGLLGNDLLGFHLSRYGEQFLDAAETLLDGATVDRADGTVSFRGHTTQVAAFPFEIDADDIRDTAAAADGRFWASFRREHGIDAGETVAIGVDRLDYTKGIPRRLDALERFFETHPEWRGRFTYVQKGCPTREGIPEYQRTRTEIENRIADLNERFGTADWSPVVYTTEMFDRANLCSLYRHADLALVSPLRDGMNLVAKEYVAAQVDDDGVLLLSPLAGAGEQLGSEALTIDPYDTGGAVDAIDQALSMPEAERRARMRSLRRTVHQSDLSRWINEVLETASRVRNGNGEQS